MNTSKQEKIESQTEVDGVDKDKAYIDPSKEYTDERIDALQRYTSQLIEAQLGALERSMQQYMDDKINAVERALQQYVESRLDTLIYKALIPDLNALQSRIQNVDYRLDGMIRNWNNYINH